MGRREIPAPVAFQTIGFGDYSALSAKAQAAPDTLTAEESAILAQPAIPYNLDAWDGYPVDRELVLATARGLRRNLVVLAGDTHNARASDLRAAEGNAVGVAFATASVSSPGLEATLTAEDPHRAGRRPGSVDRAAALCRNFAAGLPRFDRDAVRMPRRVAFRHLRTMDQRLAATPQRVAGGGAMSQSASVQGFDGRVSGRPMRSRHNV